MQAPSGPCPKSVFGSAGLGVGVGMAAGRVEWEFWGKTGGVRRARGLGGRWEGGLGWAGGRVVCETVRSGKSELGERAGEFGLGAMAGRWGAARALSRRGVHRLEGLGRERGARGEADHVEVGAHASGSRHGVWEAGGG